MAKAGAVGHGQRRVAGPGHDIHMYNHAFTFTLRSTRRNTTAAYYNVPPCSPCGCELLLAHVNDPKVSRVHCARFGGLARAWVGSYTGRAV